MADPWAVVDQQPIVPGAPPAGALPPDPRNPAQRTISAPPVGAPPAAPDLGSISPLYGNMGQPGQRRSPGLYKDDNGIVWRVHPDGRQTYGTQKEQQTYGRLPGGAGGGGAGGPGLSILRGPGWTEVAPNVFRGPKGEHYEYNPKKGTSELVDPVKVRRAYGGVNYDKQQYFTMGGKEISPNVFQMPDGRVIEVDADTGKASMADPAKYNQATGRKAYNPNDYVKMGGREIIPNVFYFDNSGIAVRVDPSTGAQTPLNAEQTKQLLGKVPVGGPGGSGQTVSPEAAEKDYLAHRATVRQVEQDTITAYQKAALPLEKQRAAMEVARGLVNQPMRTGVVNAWFNPLREAAANLGWVSKEEMATLDRTRLFETIITRMQAAMHEAGTGAVSDKDMLLFGQMVPRLKDRAETNKLVLDTMIDLADHTKRVNAARFKYWKDNQTLDGWEDFQNKDPKLRSPFMRLQSTEGISDPGAMQAIDDQNKQIYDNLEKGKLYFNPQGQLVPKGYEVQFLGDWQQ